MEKREGAVESRRYLTTQNVADLLQVQVETVRSYIKQGKLPAAKLGRDYRIAAEDVERLLRPQVRDAGAAYHVQPRSHSLASMQMKAQEAIQLRRETPDASNLRSITQRWQQEEGLDTADGERAVGKLLEDIWAATQRMAAEQPHYTPEEIAQAEREMQEIIAELRANPPHPTIKEFMEASRGYAYDPD